ncbi:MAG: MATE family efflux transporter [Ruminococcaceae bacterium]|nr:MATE family efflux transporter [Oscillospiraceae bacterium]
MLQRCIGDKVFYRHTMAVAIPIVIQNAITNFVSLLDNIMVGRVGTLEMSGVSIVNQLLFIFALCIFGANAGAGIFGAQFHGNRDDKGVRYTFRYKIIVCILLTMLIIGVLLMTDTTLIRFYLEGDGSIEDANAVLHYGKEYLRLMLWGLLPFALSNAYATTLRETGQTMVPMVASGIAVLGNLVLNYILIFGHLGAPAMGIRGAALATVISRVLELAVVAGWTHLHGKRCSFIRGAFRSLYIPGRLLGSIITKGSPLLVNECMFAIGLAVANQSYSTCGLHVVPAINISTTITNLASVGYLAMGNSVAIIMGQMLGAARPEEEIWDTNRKLTALAIVAGGILGLISASLSSVFPMLYNTSEEVRSVAGQLILISGMFIPFYAYVHATYFTLRSGGKTLITFLFDCGFMWGLLVPTAVILSRYTDLPIIPLFVICQSTEIVKSIAGYFMVRSGVWIQNLAKQN